VIVGVIAIIAVATNVASYESGKSSKTTTSNEPPPTPAPVTTPTWPTFPTTPPLNNDYQFTKQVTPSDYFVPEVDLRFTGLLGTQRDIRSQEECEAKCLPADAYLYLSQTRFATGQEINCICYGEMPTCGEWVFSNSYGVVQSRVPLPTQRCK